MVIYCIFIIVNKSGVKLTEEKGVSKSQMFCSSEIWFCIVL